MEHIDNYGILASISWNSNGWQGEPTARDLKESKYDSVKDNAHMHESLNFGHEVLPAEAGGYYIGYTPMLNRLPALAKSKELNIIFLSSSDYKNGNKKCIVGCYGSPELDHVFQRAAKHRLFKKYDGGNIKSRVENIIYFETPVVISNTIAQDLGMLPEGKEISHRGFNYLNSDNVKNILQQAVLLNAKNKKLRAYVKNLPLEITLRDDTAAAEELRFIMKNLSPDSVTDIAELERKMKTLTPRMKTRVSSYIERGSIANQIKKLTGFKCSVCKAMGLDTTGFKKPNGEYYIETHHVEPVHNLTSGSLGVANLMTLCANHHRQMHYGAVELVKVDEKAFWFEIDGKPVKINKIRIV